MILKGYYTNRILIEECLRVIATNSLQQSSIVTNVPFHLLTDISISPLSSLFSSLFSSEKLRKHSETSWSCRWWTNMKHYRCKTKKASTTKHQNDDALLMNAIVCLSDIKSYNFFNPLVSVLSATGTRLMA